MFLQTTHLVRTAARLAAAAAALAVLTGCQAIVSNPSQAQVRAIDASPDAPGIDLYRGDEALAYNLGFGAITSYVPVPPGLSTISASTAGTRQLLTRAKPAFDPAAQYTVLIGNISGDLQQLTLKDRSQPAPASRAALRFIHQATRSGPVDIYFVPTGHPLASVNPILANLRFGDITPYLDVSAGTYSLAILPAGASPGPGADSAASYIGAQIAYPSTSARTVILIDRPLPATRGLQVITAADYDPPS